MRKQSAMVLVMVVVASLVGSAAPGWAEAGRVEAGRVEAGRVDIAATAARLDALHVRIAGNREQLEASELLNYHRVEGGIAACMRAAGKRWTVRPFASRYTGFTDADLGFGTGRGSVFDSITDRGRRLIRNERAARRLARAGMLNPWESVRPADAETLNRCTAPYQHRNYLDIDPPAGVYHLSGFPGLMDGANRDPAVIAAMRPYPSCMKGRYGYTATATDRTDFLYAPRISYLDTKAQWHRGVAEVKAAFAADVDCRLPAYRIAMRRIAAHVSGWEREHQAELDVIHAAWQDRVARARYLPRTLTASASRR